MNQKHALGGVPISYNSIWLNNLYTYIWNAKKRTHKHILRGNNNKIRLIRKTSRVSKKNPSNVINSTVTINNFNENMKYFSSMYKTSIIEWVQVCAKITCHRLNKVYRNNEKRVIILYSWHVGALLNLT